MMQTTIKMKSTWGGNRKGAGRKRKKSKGVAHRTREKVRYSLPLHVNFKYKTLVRSKTTLKLLKKAIQNARSHGLRVLHYSFQSNHVHLILEASDNQLLTRGMRSLTITMAKGLNKGRIQIERYHLHVLKTLRETTNAVRYVLFNQQRHEKGTYSKMDGYSSVQNTHLVRNFAKRKKMVIEVVMDQNWKSDPPLSYLFQRCWKELNS